MLVTRFRWVSGTPLGSPLLPLVNSSVASASGSVFVRPVIRESNEVGKRKAAARCRNFCASEMFSISLSICRTRGVHGNFVHFRFDRSGGKNGLDASLFKASASRDFAKGWVEVHGNLASEKQTDVRKRAGRSGRENHADAAFGKGFLPLAGERHAHGEQFASAERFLLTGGIHYRQSGTGRR